MIVFGTRLYGLVHLVPGRFHVATRFFHLFFIPLIPLRTWIVVRESGDSWEGTPTSLSIKSVLFAWIRAALVVGYLLISGIMLSDVFDGASPVPAKSAVVAIAFSLLALVAWRLTYRFSLASSETAQNLAGKLGYPEEAARQIEVPPEARALGRPGWGLALCLIPLLVWTVAGLAKGRIAFADKYTVAFDGLRSGSFRAEDAARTMIFEIGPQDAAGVPVFLKNLDDEKVMVRRLAAIALGGVGPAAREAVTALVRHLDDDDSIVRANSAVALSKIGGGYAEAVPRLVQMLAQSDGRIAAMHALGALGPAAQRAIPELTQIAESSDADYSGPAREALKKIGASGP